MTNLQQFTKGFFKENPILVLILGTQSAKFPISWFWQPIVIVQRRFSPEGIGMGPGELGMDYDGH